MFAIEKYTVEADPYSVAKEMVKAQGKYKHLSSGAYGAVYGAKGSDVVYKIGDALDNEGYIAFVKVLAKQKKQNPFMPKIYGVRFIRNKDGDETFVVAMERLQELPRKMRDVCDWFEDAVGKGSYFDDYDRDLVQKALGIKVTMPKPLQEAVQMLNEAHKAGGNYVDWDLHSGNFMVRGEQIVVTDPLA